MVGESEEEQTQEHAAVQLTTIIEMALEKITGEPMGFSLVVSPFGCPGNVTYVSNIDNRRDAMSSLALMLGHLEANERRGPEDSDPAPAEMEAREE